MNRIIDYSRAITRALNAGMLEDAQFLIETETQQMFDNNPIEVVVEFDVSEDCVSDSYGTLWD